MSYIITIKIKGDIAAFEKALVERDAEFKEVGERGKSMGAIHHRFGVDRANGYILVVDEWADPAGFEEFFGKPEMHEFVASVGADPSTPPEITVAEALQTSDEF
jgi:quinol monooxygenase YgiN